MFSPRQKEPEQKEFWIARQELPKASPGRFYELLERTLEQMEFARQVRELCAPAYQDVNRGGRPGIDPVVYFKMLMVGFFENQPSERAIASRCADSLSLRAFLGYDLSEATPDHSSLTVIRQRLGLEIYQQVFGLILGTLREHGLLRGKNLGIDSSVIEANASLRSLVARNTEEAYWDYVRGLAQAEGIDIKDAAAVRRFDRRRPGRKTSNEDWKNPHDPDARIGKTKDGATDMTYKPEHVVDLDTGTIIGAEVLPGDQGDTEGVAGRVLDAATTVQTVVDKDRPVATLTADKGYFVLEEIAVLQEVGWKTVVSDPQRDRRRVDRLNPRDRQSLRRASRSVKSGYGKKLLALRGMNLERGFAHVLDAGGMRCATLRGLENLNKRYQIAAASFNLSQLLRKLYGMGTPKQGMATLYRGFLVILRVATALMAYREPMLGKINDLAVRFWSKWKSCFLSQKACFSTAC
jgi:transposase